MLTDCRTDFSLTIKSQQYPQALQLTAGIISRLHHIRYLQGQWKSVFSSKKSDSAENEYFSTFPFFTPYSLNI